MICKIKKTAEKYGMFSQKKSVIVGFSGGADSCTLLHALCKIKDEYSLNLTAAHVNHGIRGKEAQRDEAFAVEFCRKLGVPIKILHCNVPEEAEKAGMGQEEYGRKIRYEFFNSIDPNALVATAHNLNDCCETLLFNITRGTSVKGLRSIPAVRGNIIRPLIECTRAEIEQYCKENDIDYVTDSTNLEDNYTRNRIRLNIIPQLKKINPSFEHSVQRLMASAVEDESYFSEITADIIKKSETAGGYNAEMLKNKHPAIMKRAVSAIIEKETGSPAEAVHIKNVCNVLSGGKTQVLFGTVVSVENGILKFGENALTENWKREFLLDNEINTPLKTLKFTVIHKNEQIKKQIVHKNMLDFDSTVGKLVLRSKIQGDEIKLVNRNCTKSLKKLFTESKIKDKNSVCVLADEIGVVWIDGFGCAERCKITDKTENILKVVY